MSTKKLIAFEDDQLEKIEAYSRKTGMSFTQAVRQLAMIGLETITKEVLEDDHTPEGGMPTEIDKLRNDVDELMKNYSYFHCDETDSQVNNNKVEINNLKEKTEDMEKQLNIVVAIAKKLKGHLENRDIHLQD